MPKPNWYITFYRADVDSGTTPYTEVAKATLAGYAGYATTTAYIVAPEKTKEMEGELLTDLSGWQTGTLTVRDVFNVELWPYLYNDSSTEPDLTDWETLADWLNAKPYLWIAVNAGSRTYPSDNTKAHPVVIETVSESVNRRAGTHNVTLGLRVKGLR